MAQSASPGSPRQIVIDGHRLSTCSRWAFTVSLLGADTGRLQTVWLGTSYDSAILVAEQQARERQGNRQTPVPVHDRVGETQSS